MARPNTGMVVPSPPPPWNFAVLPHVEGEDTYWQMKKRAKEQGVDDPKPEDIEMPRNSAVGVILAFFAFVLGFALVWHIWWLAVLGMICAFAAATAHAWRVTTETTISARRSRHTVARSGRRHEWLRSRWARQ